jgi:hypothetical protein
MIATLFVFYSTNLLDLPRSLSAVVAGCCTVENVAAAVSQKGTNVTASGLMYYTLKESTSARAVGVVLLHYKEARDPSSTIAAGM